MTHPLLVNNYVKYYLDLTRGQEVMASKRYEQTDRHIGKFLYSPSIFLQGVFIGTNFNEVHFFTYLTISYTHICSFNSYVCQLDIFLTKCFMCHFASHRQHETYLWINSYQSVRSVVELFFQGDDNGLEVCAGLFTDVGRYFADVCVVQCCIYLIQYKEWRRLVALIKQETFGILCLQIYRLDSRINAKVTKHVQLYVKVLPRAMYNVHAKFTCTLTTFHK